MSDENTQSSVEAGTAPETSVHAQERMTQQARSVQDTLSQPESKENIVEVVGVFAAIGIGVGLMGIFGSSQVPIVGQAVSAGAVLAIAFTGPMMSAYFGLRLGDGMNSDSRSVLLTSAFGTGVGYFVMVMIAAILSGLSSVPGVGFGNIITGAIAFGIITGLVGAGSTYVSLRDNSVA